MPLHPFVENMLAAAREANRPGLSDSTPEAGRALIAASRQVVGSGPTMREIRDLFIPTRAGSIAGRLYLPHGDIAGLIVFFHGGGWVLGTIDDFDTLSRALAERAGCAVLVPDYRLAPEHPFPAAADDAEDACVWAAANVVELAGRPAGIVVAGDSAGGNLAAVAANALKGKVDFALQALIYPVTDCDVTRPSYETYGSDLVLTKSDMVWFLDHYAPGDVRADPRVSPLRAADLTGVAPAYVMTAEYDALRDEGEAYAARLQASGVPTVLEQADGLTHGFSRLHNLIDTADAALGKIAAACAAALQRKFQR